MACDAREEADGQLRNQVVACVKRTLAASSARVEWRRDWSLTWPQKHRGARRKGGLLRPLGKPFKVIGKAAGKAAWRGFTKDSHPGHLRADGFIEPIARRYMVDYESFAQLYNERTLWGGRSGRALRTLDPWPDHGIDLWWLLEALLGATEATVEGDEPLRGSPCRRIAARVDLERASAAVDGGLAVPEVERFENLRVLPFTVWIDNQHVRRVRFCEGRGPQSALTVDLYDFGTPTNHLDWSRLPTFRSV